MVMSSLTFHYHWLISILVILQHGNISQAFDMCKNGDRFGFTFNETLCYVWFHERLPWFMAKKKCSEEGGTLAPLSTESVNDFVFKSLVLPEFSKRDLKEVVRNFFVDREKPPEDPRLLAKYHNGHLWFGGLRYSPTSPKWVWLIDGLFGFTRWGTGYNNTDWKCLSGRPAYTNLPIVQNLDLFWYETDCLIHMPFICEFPETVRESRIQTAELLDSENTGTRVSYRIAPSIVLPLLLTRTTWIHII